MGIALWIINALLAIAFIGSGAMKLIRPKDALVTSGMGWAESLSPPTIKVISLLEIAGALGLILPRLLNLLPILTPLAAVGLAVVMLCATIVHLRRHEPPVPPVILLVVAIVSAVLGFIVVA